MDVYEDEWLFAGWAGWCFSLGFLGCYSFLFDFDFFGSAVVAVVSD